MLGFFSCIYEKLRHIVRCVGRTSTVRTTGTAADQEADRQQKEPTMTKRIRLPAIAVDAGKVRLGGIINPLPRIVADAGKVRLGGIAPIV